MTVLDTLNFVAFNPLQNNNPIAVRRRKLIAKIDEQIQLAVNKGYTPTQHKWVTDEHGNQRKVEVAKRVKRWWTASVDGKINLVVRYGSKPLEFAKGKNAIELVSEAEVADVIGKKPAPMVADFLKHLNEDYVLVIEDTDNSQIMGYAVIVLKDYEYWLENIAVCPTKTKQGFGTQLIRNVEDFVSKSASTIQLYTNVKMYENIDWYKRIGYSEFKRKTVDGFERVYFIKEL